MRVVFHVLKMHRYTCFLILNTMKISILRNSKRKYHFYNHISQIWPFFSIIWIFST